MIQANELAELLRNVIIPLPQGGGPPMRGPQQQQQQQQKPMGAGPSMGAGGRDMPPSRGGYGRGGGRGGFKSRVSENRQIIKSNSTGNIYLLLFILFYTYIGWRTRTGRKTRCQATRWPR